MRFYRTSQETSEGKSFVRTLRHQRSQNRCLYYLLVYVVLVIWTPILSFPPLPPVRLDDAWLLIWVGLTIGRSESRTEGLDAAGGFPFLCLFGLAVLSALAVLFNLALEGEGSLRALLTVGTYLRMAVLLWLITKIYWTVDSTRLLAIVYVIATTLSAVIVLIQYFGIYPLDAQTIGLWTDYSLIYVDELVRGKVSRTVGTIGNPNYLGEFFCLNLAFSLFLVGNGIGSKEAKRYMVLGALSALISLYVIIFCSASRTAVIATIAILFYYVFGLLWIRRHVGTGAVGALLLVGTLSFVIYRGGEIVIPERVTMMTEVRSASEISSTDDLLGGRIAMWQHRWNVLRDNPRILLVGLGITSNELLITDNGYFRLLLQSGILGLLAGCSLWIYLVWHSHRNIIKRNAGVYYQNEALLIVSGITTFVIFEFSSDGLVQAKVSCMIAVFTGALLKANRITSRR